jgi:hypothetical protein
LISAFFSVKLQIINFLWKFASGSKVKELNAGFILFFMQLHGYLHTVNEEEFGLNRDEHYHIHMDMQKVQQEAKQKRHTYEGK